MKLFHHINIFEMYLCMYIYIYIYIYTREKKSREKNIFVLL